MAKFLQYDTAANGSLVIPAEEVLWVKSGTSTTTIVFMLGASAFDQVTVTHAADTSAYEMVGYLQDKLVEAAQGKWSEAVLNITADSPLVISNIQLA